jgi:hypothetical protein
MTKVEARPRGLVLKKRLSLDIFKEGENTFFNHSS